MLTPFEMKVVQLNDRPNCPEADGVFWRAVRLGHDENLSISLERWVHAKDTPKGCWILPEWLNRAETYREDWREWAKLVIHDSVRKHAYPTKDEAFADLMRRNDWWRRFLMRDLDRAFRTNEILKQRGDT